MKKNHFYSLVLFGAVTGWLWLAMLAQTLMSVSTWGDLPVTLLLCVLTGGGAALLFNAAWMKVSSRFFGAHENVPEYEPTPFAGKVSLTAVVIVSLLGAAQGYSYSKKTLEEARLKQAYEQKRQRDSVVKAEAEKRKSDAEDALQRSRHAAEVEELKHGLANLTALQFGSRSWQTEARQLARRIEALPDFSAKNGASS